jgi:hypothetical protein
MNFTELNNKYGHAVHIPVTKSERPKRELTVVVNETRERLRATIAAVAAIEDLKELSPRAFRSPMAWKRCGRIVVQVGYGKRNTKLDETKLPKRYFTTAEEAGVYLQDVLEMLDEGQLDELLLATLNERKAAAEHARSQKKNTKGANKSYNRSTVVEETIMHAPEAAPLVKMLQRALPKMLPNDLSKAA